jgi:hypothetical protein
LTGAAEILEGRVVGVHNDGDAITLLMAGNHQVKIRLAQIDALESIQAFGQRSKQSLSEMVFNKTIQVEKETILEVLVHVQASFFFTTKDSVFSPWTFTTCIQNRSHP